MRPQEFSTLMSLIRPRIVAAAINIVGNRDDADDVAQETVLKMWELGDRLHEFRSPLALALTIARRKSIDFVRQSGRLVDVDVSTSRQIEITREEMMILEERRREVDNVMSRLPEPQQTLLRMRHVDGMSTAEMATILATSEGSVRTALSRARNNVRKLFLNQCQ